MSKKKWVPPPDYYKKRNAKSRKAAIDHYGDKCEFCGETEYDKLCLHFSFGDRKTKHKGIGRGMMMYQYLKRNNYPDDWGVKVACKLCVDKIHARQRASKKKLKGGNP